jgi:DNA-binding GntR family transcriptional regulator
MPIAARYHGYEIVHDTRCIVDSHDEGVIVEAGTLADRVYENLKHRILRQEFRCGERLNIAALAKDLNVSNTPVREAISRLEKVGLVKIAPYRGPSVRSLSVSETAEVYDVRISLEVLAARLAALHATPESLAMIEDRLREYETARGGGDMEETLNADLRFHEAIALASGNRTLIDMLSMLSDWTKLFMQFGMPPARPPSATGSTHARIVNAIRSGDKELAASAMREHLVAGKVALMRHLEENGRPPEPANQPVYVDVW